ncbi:transcription factor TFIID complex subunit 8 C-term-domain-containing protein [Lipomyces chichibuensis]|uniref:transcription factor TFIID complex subunit 8 C-term-domain-containing protein n=1 Tax=Lipomyces chichibuensis TaxID=1546026 RepID=UPI003344221A
MRDLPPSSGGHAGPSVLDNGSCEQAGELLVRPVAVDLQALDIRCSGDALQYLSVIAEEYFLRLLTRLHKITMIQRRSKPGIRDLALLFTEEGIFTSDLEEEYFRTQFIFQEPPPAPTLQGNGRSAEDGMPTMKWIEQQKELAALVPSTRTQADTAYIPGWMPPLPADHTYRSTPIFANRTTSPRDVRERILEEGRVVEEALRKLGSGNAGEGSDAEVRLLEDNDEDNGSAGDLQGQGNLKGFDIVAFATARKKRSINPIILHIGKKAKA